MRIGWWLVVAAAVAVAAPAQARARDDVMAAAYRCGAIADDKVWLDCFYGAAQPVRSQLGLPPALEAQVRLAASPPTGGEARNATVRDEALAGAARCYSLVDDQQWLGCYYNAALPVRSLLNLPQPRAQPPALVTEAPAFAVRKPAPTPPGGFSDWLGGADNQRIISRLASYSFDRYKIFTVTLVNGQVWQQLSGDTSYARWTKPAGSYTAVIKRGALGSIDFQVQNEPHVFKVSRIK